MQKIIRFFSMRHSHGQPQVAVMIGRHAVTTGAMPFLSPAQNDSRSEIGCGISKDTA